MGHSQQNKTKQKNKKKFAIIIKPQRHWWSFPVSRVVVIAVLEIVLDMIFPFCVITLPRLLIKSGNITGTVINHLNKSTFPSKHWKGFSEIRANIYRPNLKKCLKTCGCISTSYTFRLVTTTFLDMILRVLPCFYFCFIKFGGCNFSVIWLY